MIDLLDINMLRTLASSGLHINPNLSRLIQIARHTLAVNFLGVLGLLGDLIGPIIGLEAELESESDLSGRALVGSSMKVCKIEDGLSVGCCAFSL